MPYLIRPELLALEYCECLKRVQDEPVLVPGRKAQEELLDIGKLPLMNYRKFPFSNEVWQDILLYTFS